MPPTLRDVARIARTSPAAVSVTLNGTTGDSIRIGKATRERILAAAEELGYTPNRLAQSLVLRKTGILGLAFPYSHAFVDRNPFCTQIMSGVFEEAIRARYNLMLHTATGDDWNAADEGALIDPRVDGLLLVLPSPDSPVVERCLRQEFPCVALGYAPHSEVVCAVNSDDFTGGRVATEHLVSLGHRRIAHFVGRPGIATTEPRKRGYLAALEAGGEKFSPDLLVPAGFAEADGYAAMQRLLLETPKAQLPTAIFAANDPCAVGALQALEECGVRVPDDMAMVGYDDTWYAAMTSPPLTSVRMPILEMGALATTMLIELIEGRTPAERQPILPVSLTIRQSCGAQPLR